MADHERQLFYRVRKFCDMMMRSVTGKTSACMLIATRKSIVMEAHFQVSVDIYCAILLRMYNIQRYGRS